MCNYINVLRDKKRLIFHRALRFEDLAMQPMKKALEIVDFLDFPTIRNNLETYIDRHSRARKPNNLVSIERSSSCGINAIPNAAWFSSTGCIYGAQLFLSPIQMDSPVAACIEEEH